MGLAIPITGIGPEWRKPGGYAEILYNQGPASAYAPGREVVLVMPMSSGGGWTTNTLYQVTSDAQASAGAGPGSPLHRGLRKFLQVNKSAKLWALPYAASSGGSPTSATGTCVIATTPTAAGTVTLYICGEACSARSTPTDTPTTIGANLALSVNGKPWLPVTAANVSGTVTLTAKIAGASQGTATLKAIGLHSEITAGTSTTVTTSTHIGAVAAGSDGTTTESANLTTALAVIDSVRKYYVGVSVIDATGIGALKTHIVNKSSPRRGLRSRGFAFYPGSQSNGQTLAIGLNYERVSVAFMPNPDNDPAEMVGAMTAIFQLKESVHSAWNFDGYSLNGIINPQFSTADWLTAENQNDAINAGLMPLSSTDTGVSLVMATTTHSKDSTGTYNDPRSLEPHRVSVTDEFVDEEMVEYALNFASKRLADDTRLANGKVDPKQNEIPGVVRPSLFRKHIEARVDAFFELGKLQNAAASKASLQVIKTGSRLECGLDLNSIDLLHQATYRVAEVSSG